MPPFFDGAQLRGAINGHAVAALEALAANPDRLDRSLNRRFERDEPPAYESSSESEGEEALYHEVLARPREVVLEEFKGLLSQPFDKYEFDAILDSLYSLGIYNPGERYRDEARREDELLRDFCRSQPWDSAIRDLLDIEIGSQRRAVIVRHNIRKRWQRLGVWNSDWGIPGRVNEQDKDDIELWKWKWQTDADPSFTDPDHIIMRVMESRKKVPYGERALPAPHAHLREDSTASEAESFITSRPWFLYCLETVEYVRRRTRIPPEQLGRPDPDQEGQVKKWWKTRGDWEQDWETQASTLPVPGWKWRHESPSPEPEDLSVLESGEMDMDFTPSEVDALDAIELKMLASESIEPSEPELVSGCKPGGFRFGNVGVSGRYDDPEPGDQLLQEEEEALEGEEAAPSPRPRRRGRLRKTEQSNGPVHAPPARRSARIKAIESNPPPFLAMTITRTSTKRVSRRHPATPPSRTLNTKAPKKRGRPPKAQSGGITKPAPPPKKRGRSPKLAKAAIVPSAPAASKDIQEAPNGLQPRKRGHPRGVSAAPPLLSRKISSSTDQQQPKQRGRPRKVVQEGGIAKATAAPSTKRESNAKAPAAAAADTTEASRRGTRSRPSRG